MAENLIEGLNREIERNEELVKVYDTIPTGAFGAMMIRNDIARAKRALETGDTVGMISALASPKGNK